MNNARISWDLPTTRLSGRPLLESEIFGVDVSISADAGQNWTGVDIVEPPSTDVTVNDLADGDWLVRCVVIDAEGKRSSEVDTPFVVDDSNPGEVTNVTVSLS